MLKKIKNNPFILNKLLKKTHQIPRNDPEDLTLVSLMIATALSGTIFFHRK